MKEQDITHLQWIYDRMILKGDSENIDYMSRFKSIIDSARINKAEQDKQLESKMIDFIEMMGKTKGIMTTKNGWWDLKHSKEIKASDLLILLNTNKTS